MLLVIATLFAWTPISGANVKPLSPPADGRSVPDPMAHIQTLSPKERSADGVRVDCLGLLQDFEGRPATENPYHRLRKLRHGFQVMSDASRVAIDRLPVGRMGGGFGAELCSIDLRQIDDMTFAQIRDAWLDHSVLLVRDQHLSDDQLIAFSRRFGDLDLAPMQETGRRFVDGLPELYVVSNVIENGEPIGSLGAGEAVWHTDMSYVEQPPKASALYALEVPDHGGDTSFVDMYAVYEALPPRLKQRIAGLRVKHDGTYNSGGYVRRGVTPSDDPRVAPGALHPLVYVHPDTRRPALYLGRRRNAYIEGLALADSEALLEQLWFYVDRPDFSWTHHWRAGDLVLWDNRCTMHRRDAFDPQDRRVLHRTQIKSEARPA